MDRTLNADLSLFDEPTDEQTITDPIAQLHTDISSAYAVLMQARQEHHAASERAIQFKEVLDDTESDFLLGGMASGKNAEERAARMADLTRPQRQSWRDACRAERTTRMVLEGALDKVQQLKLQVTLVGGCE